MSTETERAPFATPAEQTTPSRDLGTLAVRGRPEDVRTVRRVPMEGIGLAAAVVATLVTYGFFIVQPWPHGPLNEFLAGFARGNAAIWPMQLVWYAGAAAMVGLALWPRRRSTQLICVLAAAYFAWVGIAYFGVLNSKMNFAGLWAAVFILEGILFVVAGIVRRDLVIAPHRDLASVLGAVLIGYALVGYPIIGLLGGHPLSTLPVFGFSPCASVIFCFGLLLWARPPAPLYLLPIPLAWALGATPSAMATGVVVDYGLALAGVITALVILWRDRRSSWQTVAAGVLLTLMIAWSGHDDVLLGIALVLVAVTFAQTIRSAAPMAPQSREQTAGAT
ncbi:MAG: DUF6064 family protein [Ktedonobacterales bacterium]